MVDYFGRRIVNSAFSLVALISLVFFMARMTGSPADLFLPIDAAPELRQKFTAELGLDDPVIVQFGRFLRGALHFDFGMSLHDGRSALAIVLAGAPTTLALAGITMAIAIVVGI